MCGLVCTWASLMLQSSCQSLLTGGLLLTAMATKAVPGLHAVAGMRQNSCRYAVMVTAAEWKMDMAMGPLSHFGRELQSSGAGALEDTAGEPLYPLLAERSEQELRGRAGELMHDMVKLLVAGGFGGAAAHVRLWQKWRGLKQWRRPQFGSWTFGAWCIDGLALGTLVRLLSERLQLQRLRTKKMRLWVLMASRVMPLFVLGSEGSVACLFLAR